MENFLRSRIRDRLEALNLNPFEAARRIPAERTFINDLLIGKKDTIRQSAIPKVAAALECDPEYLLGVQDKPRRQKADRPANPPEIPRDTPSPTVPLVGVAELGAWRPAGHTGPHQTLPLTPDPRHPAAAQVAYLLRGDYAAGMGATDGSILLAVRGAPYRDGDAVIVRRSRTGEDGPEEEITIRRVMGGNLETAPLNAAPVAIRAGDVEVVGRVISAHLIF